MKKALVTIAALAVVACCVLLSGAAAAGTGGPALPQPITAESACPVSGCANGTCHGYADVPEPDGVHEMTCPESSCQSTECHAWESLTSGKRKASDASLNAWIMVPAVIACGVIVLAGRTGRGKR